MNRQFLAGALAALAVACSEEQPPDPLLPRAASADAWQWQGQQAALQTCEARAALALGDQATCYRGTDGGMRCAGRIYETTFGPGFADSGVSGVDQIFIAWTVNQENGNSICVHKTDGTAACMGYLNCHGEFGTGGTSPSSTFTQWGSATNLVALGTGTWDQFCAIDTEGTVSCSGDGFGATPVVQGEPASHDRFWVTTAGEVRMDDATVLRASESRTECTITSEGLQCAGRSFGMPGHVVAGGRVARVPGAPVPDTFDPLFLSCPFRSSPEPTAGACWLADSGDVQCASCASDGSLVTTSHFEPGNVVSLGLNFYGASLCAAYVDGSLWCVGENPQGMLGTGDEQALPVATRVRPPGSVDVGCRAP